MAPILYRLAVLSVLFAHANSQNDCEERDIRLTDDRFSTPLEGRVQVCLNGVWGTVCNDGWLYREENNDVVCRQVGAKLGVDILSNGSIYRGSIGKVNSQYSTLPKHLSSVRCTGDEDNLLDCQSSSYGCNSYHEVTVMCIPTDPTSPLLPNCTGEQFQCLNGFCATENQLCNGRDNCGDNSDETGCNNCVEGDIRLNGTFHRTPLAGRVELCLGGIWGSICTYTEGRWTDENVMVACRQLGGELGVSISSSYNLGNSRNVPEPDALLDESGPAISMIGVNCVGDEESLFDCSFRQEVDGDCYQYNNNVAVLCVPTDPASPLLPNCTGREFKCLNGYCVDEVFVCDGRNNCGDNSDETAPECLILQNKSRQDIRDTGNVLIVLSIGVSLGIVFPILLIWLVIFGICMLVPQCPLSNLYSRKAVVGPNPATRQGVSGDERGEANEPETERSNAPLFIN